LCSRTKHENFYFITYLVFKVDFEMKLLMKRHIIILIIHIFQITAYDSRFFKHGTQKNEIDGGTCKEFLEINRLDQCCTKRDDDCFMVHYDTRCYCDIFCDRSSYNDYSDCCPDALITCNTNITKGFI
jgi:hypothetical protein